MDKNKDFEEIADMINASKGVGVSVEEYCKKTDLSVIVGRYKLGEYYKEGKLCLDSSLGGLRYFLNDLISVEFK